MKESSVLSPKQDYRAAPMALPAMTCATRKKSLYFTRMNFRNQALAVSQLPSLTSTLLLAGLLLRASAK
jgi:hypothetical protein